MNTRWKRQVSSILKARTWKTLPAAVGIIALLIWISGNDVVMNHLQGGLARITAAILALLGQPVLVEGNTLWANGFGISVVTACTGLFTTGVFLIAVVAYPARWLAKLAGAGIGIGGLLLVNLVRLVSLYYIGVHMPNFLDVAHLLIWQSLLIVFAVLLWLLWAGRVAHASRAT